MKTEVKPDLSIFGTQELFAEIAGRHGVVGAVLMIEHLPQNANKAGTGIAMLSSVGPSMTIGMLKQAEHKLLHSG